MENVLTVQALNARFILADPPVLSLALRTWRRLLHPVWV